MDDNVKNALLTVQLPNGKKVLLEKGGYVADVPENAELLAELARGKHLTPEQLFKLGSLYHNNPETRHLGDRLFVDSMAMVMAGKKVREAFEKIANEPVDWSIWDDIVNAIIGFFGQAPTTVPSGLCVYSCVWFTLWRKCPSDRAFTLDGVCFGISGSWSGYP
jgi:hypothetical protein